MSQLASLLQAGFERVGAWHLTPTRDGIALMGKAARKAGVYVYAVDGTICYVGSAQRGLHSRFRRYVTSMTMRTSARVRAEIVTCLLKGQAVEVYTLRPPVHVWSGLPVDLIAGLEEGLIRQLRPVWNKRSNPRLA